MNPSGTSKSAAHTADLHKLLARLVFACNWRDACVCGSDAGKLQRAVEEYGRALDDARAAIDAGAPDQPTKGSA